MAILSATTVCLIASTIKATYKSEYSGDEYPPEDDVSEAAQFVRNCNELFGYILDMLRDNPDNTIA